jgi:hypothetical protein
MPRINDRCVTIFKEAAKTVLENFTVPELADFESMADKIDAIIKRAQQRLQDRIEQA